ncbi:AI-2E family transporter [Pendulispora albinea]|uniref:AI-2E family transporter n=1 Tax=Pendulispora albinea TaxID=2741071 RepID=A0ABZ2M7T0_9BACT
MRAQTRGWPEVEAALGHMVAAARELRVKNRASVAPPGASPGPVYRAGGTFRAGWYGSLVHRTIAGEAFCGTRERRGLAYELIHRGGCIHENEARRRSVKVRARNVHACTRVEAAAEEFDAARACDHSRPMPRGTLQWITLALVVAAAWACYPIWPALLLGIWAATMARPLLERVSKITGGRKRAAAALTVLLVLALVVPIVVAVVPLAHDASTLVAKLSKSEGAQTALRALVSNSSPTGDPEAPPEPSTDLFVPVKSLPGLTDLVREHGAAAMRVAGQLAGVFANALLLFFLFFYATYTFLTDGPDLYTWFESHMPMARPHTRRMAAAFNETGRGLLVGVGLAGLSQGLVATVTYVALGIPRALVLGLLTCVASLLPSVGTALVWAPVAVGLALSGRTAAAIIMAVVGVAVVGSIDNLLRPVFARYGQLELSTFALLISIFGGLAAFGGWGVVLGPLLFRMTKEALAILREGRARDVPAPDPRVRDSDTET